MLLAVPKKRLQTGKVGCRETAGGYRRGAGRRGWELGLGALVFGESGPREEQEMMGQGVRKQGEQRKCPNPPAGVGSTLPTGEEERGPGGWAEV